MGPDEQSRRKIREALERAKNLPLPPIDKLAVVALAVIECIIDEAEREAADEAARMGRRQ